jgi:hypothetical protein
MKPFPAGESEMRVLTQIPIVTNKETISVGTGSDSTLAPTGGATHGLMTVDPGGGGIRYWEDGASPSSTVGLYVAPGGAAELTNLANVRMRSTTGTVAVNISYRKYG